MILYGRFLNRFAVCAEISRAYGLWPLYGQSQHRKEIIIDLPFMRIIITPASRLFEERIGKHNDSSAQEASTKPDSSSTAQLSGCDGRAEKAGSGISDPVRHLSCGNRLE